VASERGAVTAQDGAAAFTTDAQARAPRGTGATLTTDADTGERARHVRSGSTVHRGTFASDQPRLTARAGTQRSVATHAGGPAGIAGACQTTACGGNIGLTSQIGTTSQATAGTKSRLAG